MKNLVMVTSISNFIYLVCLSVCPVNIASGNDVQNHLDMGRKHLENRQFSDALTHFHAAVEGDPSNYQTYFKRALVLMALGKYNQALRDLDKVIELKSDFSSAILQRANLLLKQGDLDGAHVDYEALLRQDHSSVEAEEGYHSVEVAKLDLTEAKYYVDINDCHTAVDLLNRLIDVCPWNADMRNMRSDCYMQLGDAQRAISDLRFTTKLQSDDTEGLYRLSSIQYQLGDTEQALKEIRECLKLDPEHKHCFPLYKKLKKLMKLLESAEEAAKSQNFRQCIDDVKKALKVDSNSPPMVQWNLRHKLCWYHLKNGDGSLAVDHCTKALDYREDVEILCDRAEAYLLDDNFSSATDDYRRALEIDEDNRRAKEGLSRSQKLEKQSKKRDYYKILGVKKTATKQEITKAYRKMAQKWHPDNFQGDDKKNAENKFIDIAAAKEVLTDPEKRKKFDMGEDPLDPDSHSHGDRFNPFANFHFSHSGPFHFTFH